MSTNISSMITGLALLQQRSGGVSPFSSFASETPPIESRAIRLAKAQFTAPPSTPPWRNPNPAAGTNARLSQVRAMRSLVDQPPSTSRLGPDIETSFTVWKALDRLKVLANAATRSTLLASERSAIGDSFAKGLSDLQAFMGTAATNQLNLSFGQPARRADTVAVERPPLSGSASGRAVATTRSEAISGLNPAATMRVTVSKFGTTQSFDLNVANLVQPPNLDNVAAGLNDGLASLTNVLGRFSVEKSGDKWRLAYSGTASEAISLDEVGAADALMVVTTDGTTESAGPVRVARYNAPESTMERQLLGLVTANDREAMLTSAKPDVVIPAAIAVSASVTDSQGFTTLLGTTAGDVDSLRNDGDGQRDVLLTRLDSSGRVVWQRMLGAAGDTQGAALSLDANGDVVVAATVAGGPGGGLTGTDGLGASDMLVAKYDALGEERFATLVARSGNEQAAAVAITTDGSIVVGGSTGTGSDGVLVRLSSTGQLAQFQTMTGSGAVRSLATASDGSLLALTQTGTAAQLQRFDATNLASGALQTRALGNVQATQITVSVTGQIAVGGNDPAGTSGSRDAFVELVSADFASANRTLIGTAGSEQLDSLVFAADGQTLHVGGRTSGTLGGQKTGTVDAFVARLDANAGGAVSSITQFGQSGRETGPVRLSFSQGGATKAPEALGFHRGQLNSTGQSPSLVASTRLRAGDSFKIRVGTAPARTVTVAANDTLATFADKVRGAAGSRATITTPFVNTTGGKPGQALRIQAKEGYPIQLTAGPDGRDALGPLGLAPSRIFVPPLRRESAPAVAPGGQFGLGLTTAINLGSADDAKFALSKLDSALSVTQTGYRSMYWDNTKALLVDGGTQAAPSALESARLQQYQQALGRLNMLASVGPGTGF